MNQFEIGEGGRVKMAGAPVDIYYDAAEPLIDGGNAGALVAHQNFTQLRDHPPDALRAAYFPSIGPELQQRLRGAGLYRYLRMDQGPGGNFTAFTVDTFGTSQSDFELSAPVPHALLEESVRRQIGVASELGMLATTVAATYATGNLGKTFALLGQFKEKSEAAGIALPTADVGSRSGFFLINPVESSARLSARTERAVQKALDHTRALAGTARHLIKAGVPFAQAVELARSSPELDSEDIGLLYFQPDCLVDTEGNVAVEKINFPDVGFFLTEIETGDNKPLNRVVEIVQSLQRQVVASAGSMIETPRVTIVAKDEAILHATDMLEVNEAKALTTMLESIGLDVTVIGTADYEQITSDNTVLILNPNITSQDFAKFTEKIVREDIACYPDPLLKAFEAQATTLQTFTAEGKQLTYLLDLIRPKSIDAHNAPQIHERLSRVLSLGGVPEDVDILYAYVKGQKIPIPLFRHSLHSFMQLYNAVERSRRQSSEVGSVMLRAIPFQRQTAVFGDANGKRLAAFRPMYIRRPR